MDVFSGESVGIGIAVLVGCGGVFDGKFVLISGVAVEDISAVV
jgi:hypothetical protein